MTPSVREEVVSDVNSRARLALVALSREAHLSDDPEEQARILSAAGRATYGTRLRLLDDDGRDVPAGHTGELVARAPNVMSGYLDNPEATAEALSFLLRRFNRTLEELRFGDVIHLPLEAAGAKLTAKPVNVFDMGVGSGARVEADIEGGVVGLVLDGRGRPFELPKARAKRIDVLNKWYKAMEMYPV